MTSAPHSNYSDAVALPQRLRPLKEQKPVALPCVLSTRPFSRSAPPALPACLARVNRTPALHGTLAVCGLQPVPAGPAACARQGAASLMPGSHPITNSKPRVAGWQRSQAAPLPWPVHPHEQAATPRQGRAAPLGCLWGFRAKRGQRGVKSALPHPPQRPTLQRPLVRSGGRFRVGGDRPGWAGGRGHLRKAASHRSESKSPTPSPPQVHRRPAAFLSVRSAPPLHPKHTSSTLAAKKASHEGEANKSHATGQNPLAPAIVPGLTIARGTFRHQDAGNAQVDPDP